MNVRRSLAGRCYTFGWSFGRSGAAGSRSSCSDLETLGRPFRSRALWQHLFRPLRHGWVEDGDAVRINLLHLTVDRCVVYVVDFGDSFLAAGLAVRYRSLDGRQFPGQNGCLVKLAQGDGLF